MALEPFDGKLDEAPEGLKPFDGKLEDAPQGLKPFDGRLDGEPEPSSAVRRVVGDTGVALAKGIIGVPESAVGLGDIATGGHLGRALDSLGFRPKEAREALDALLSPEQQAANQKMAAEKGFFPTIQTMLQNPSTIAQTVAESLPSVGAGGVVARGAMAALPKLTPVIAGAVGEGTVSAAQTAEQVRQETADQLLTPTQGAIAAGSGAITGLIGAAGGKIAQRLGISDIDTLVAGGAAGTSSKGLARRVGEGALSEGVLEELPQSYQEQVAQNIALGKPWDEGAAQQAAQGMMAGGVMGGGAGVIHTHPAEGDKKPLFPFITEGAALRQAENLAKTTGLEYEIGAHPDVPGRFAIYPAGERPAPTPAVAEAASESTPAEVPNAQNLENPVSVPAANEGTGERTADNGRVDGALDDAAAQAQAGGETTPVTSPAVTAPVSASVTGERRTDAAQRSLVADMTDQEKTRALLTNPVSDLPNKRAWQEKEQRGELLPYKASIDLDDFKTVNDRFGHEAGDRILRAVGQELAGAMGPDVHHFSGDEFAAHGEEQNGLRSALDGARDRLKDTEFVFRTPNGDTVIHKGIGFSYGIANTYEQADHALQSDKRARKSDGERVGERDAVAVHPEAAAGQQTGGRETAPAAEEVAPKPAPAPEPAPAAPSEIPKAEAPTVDQAAHEAATSPQNDKPHPSPDQIAAGNYAKGHDRIAGMPLSVENPEGSTRFKYNVASIQSLQASLNKASINLNNTPAGRTAATQASMRLTSALDNLQRGDPAKAVEHIGKAEELLRRLYPDHAAVADRILEEGWHTKMPYHYGYFLNTIAPDKDHVDVAIKPGTPRDFDGAVHVVAQNKADGSYDEPKVFMGYKSADEARAAYIAGFDSAEKAKSLIRGIRTFPTVEDFKKWAYNAELTKKSPVGEAPSPKKDEPQAPKKPSAQEAKALAQATRTVHADLFGALRNHALLPTIATDSPESFKAKIEAAAAEWRANAMNGADDARRAAIEALPKELDAKMLVALKREALRAKKEADAEKPKLLNTGVDLRRSWELVKAQLKAKDEAEGIAGMNRIFAATTRADFFSGLISKDATPGTQRYADLVRETMPTFKEWLTDNSGPLHYVYGTWSKTPNDIIANFVRGASHVDSDGAKRMGLALADGADSSSLSVQRRLDALRDMADEYRDNMQLVLDALASAKTVGAAAKSFTDLVWKSGALSKDVPYWKRLDEERLTDVGKRLKTAHFLDANSLQKLTAESYAVSALIGKEGSADSEQQRKKPLVPPKLEHIVREGLPSVREGDVTPKAFKEKFGFADIGFGSWVKSAEDQAHLNHAHDAFADLAAHLGIDPKYIGFGGKLHFTLGALGHGSKAAATFHPAHPLADAQGKVTGTAQVINLTKTHGDGTVAHEWFHALDHFLSLTPDGRTAMRQIVADLKTAYDFEKLRAAAIRGLQQQSWIQGQKRVTPTENATNLVHYYLQRPGDSQFKREADAMDPKYWGNDQELRARAWEAWVGDALGGTNNYLVNTGWSGDGATKPPTYKGTPYPTGDERKRFAEDFKALRASLVQNPDGTLAIDMAKWQETRPKEAEAYRDAAERMIQDLPVMAEQLRQEQEMKVTAAQQQAQDAAKRDLEATTPPVTQPPAGTLDAADFERLFDLAAENVRAENGENATAPETGATAFTGENSKTTPKAAPAVAEGQDKKASALIAAAAQQGVKGIDEALTGLTKLFGGGKLSSFPGSFDEGTYAKAKPHFEAALRSFQAAGKSLMDLFKLLIEQFGEGVKPYAIRFAQDMKLTAALGEQPSATKTIAQWVKGQLNRPGFHTQINSTMIFERANEAFGGTQAEGKYTPKDAYDAVEAGMNLWILENAGRTGLPLDPEAAGARVALATLKEKTALLPTQTKRTGEQDEFQQFSTIPALAYMANWVANIQPGETMGEPSAGIGGLAVFAKAMGALPVVNEFSSRRAAILREVLPEVRVFSENAEQIGNILPEDTRPTVIVMNPPFSATAGRMEGTRDTMTGAQHVESALQWLKPGGRLVAIVGQGMADGQPRFRPWWAKIKETYNVRAVMSLNGAEYAKYGTTYDNVLMVIDKTGPTEGSTLTGRVEAYADLPALLEGVRNDRTQPATDDLAPERPADQQSGGQAVAVGVGGIGDTQHPQLGDVGSAAGNLPGAGGRSGRADGRGPGKGAANGDTGTGRRGGTPGQRAGSPEPGRGGQLDLGSDQRSAEHVELDAAAIEQRNQELTDSVFENYEPRKARVRGAQAHPTKLVESAAMAAVEPADVRYTPHLPRDVVEQGRVSAAQLEAVIYAGQAHEEKLPDGSRRGYFIGDGTGVGKGREIAAVILDNQQQGRNKAVWLSASAGLVRDARRDYGAVVGKAAKDVSDIFELRDAKNGGASPSGNVSRPAGIMFTTYDTLKGGEKAEQGKTPQTSVKQIVGWLGADFDGVIAFDEAHKMKNLGGQKGTRGVEKGSARALAAAELRKALPNARVLYVSATGATEVSNLAYTDRLGLWGANTAFANANEFITKIGSAGLAAMELVARDMKAMGVYTSRSLSYDGVEQTMIDASFTPLQKEIYNELAQSWQIILKNIEKALQSTGQSKDGQAKGRARSAFWSSQQRFFNQVITAMMTPQVIDDVRTKLADGYAVLFQLVNTNEATQERQIERAEADNVPLEELDFSPKQILIEYLKKGFPVDQYEDYIDPDGKKKSRPVMDSQGQPVINREAAAQRDTLIDHIDKNLRVPDNPIDLIYEALGEANVGEVTGRGRRYQKVLNDGAFTLEERKRTGKASEADAQAFMDDKKRVLVFTDAGGTGYSFHSDADAKNQRRRYHVMLQPGWIAENAMQGLGRSHRSNEVNQPLVGLPRSDLKAQKRFISSIARRLDQLGALSKGQRNTASQGLFNARDNLESRYAKAALRQLIEDMAPNNNTVPNAAELISAMGLDETFDRESGGGVIEGKMPTIERFLNRLLSLTTSQQDQLFGEFEMRMDAAVEAAVQNGTYDDGMQTVKAQKVAKLRDEVVHVDERSKASTRYIELELTQPTVLNDWSRLQGLLGQYPGKGVTYYFDHQTKQPFAVIDLGTRMDGSGRLQHRGYRFNVVAPSMKARGHYIDNRDSYEGGGQKIAFQRDEATGDLHTNPQPGQGGVAQMPRYKKIGNDEAQYMWGKSLDAAPKTYAEQLNLLAGALLPVWDRIDTGADKTVAVVRTQTDDGERIIGRVLPNDDRSSVLKKLGVGAIRADMQTSEIIARIMRGETAQLANGWLLKRVRVSNEPRIEISAVQMTPGDRALLEKQGAIVERINYENRIFVPMNNEGAFEALTRAANRPVVDFFPAKAGSKNDLTPMASRSGEAGSVPVSVSNAISRLSDHFGAQAINNLTSSGFLRVVPNAEQAPAYLHQTAVGADAVYDPRTGTAYIFSDQADPARLPILLLHELGEHHGLERMVGPEGYSRLLDGVRAANLNKNALTAAAWAHVRENYRELPEGSDRFVREVIARVGESAAEKPAWFHRLIAAVRGFLRSLGFNAQVSDAEIMTLVRSSLNRVIAEASPQTATTGNAQQPAMASRPGADTFGDRIAALRGSGRTLTNAVQDALYTDKTFNFWHKSVGTQYHKAQVDPDFKRVYDRGQDYLHEFSRAAMDSADRAQHLLPKLEGFRSALRSIAGAAKTKDIAAINKPLIEGTLQAENGDPHQGRVWTDGELREQYHLNDVQIGLYREARAAIDASLDNLHASEVVNLAREHLDPATIEEIRANPGNAGQIAGMALLAQRDPALGALAQQLGEKQQTMESLKEHGYAPLMRFGKYSVSAYAVGEDGQRGDLQYFSLHEKQSEAAAARRAVAEEFPEADVVSGIKSELSYQLYRGLTPDTLELFAHTMGVDQDAAFQQYLKVAKNTRSAFKRLIHRQGVSGFGTDATRNLAAFITSNARATAGNWHMGELVNAAEDVPQGKGDVKDEAVKLVSYLQNPREEAPALRSYLFMQYLGGSFASALVNMTQPLVMTLPYLAQWGTGRAATRLLGAMGQAARDHGNLDPALRAALARADADGVTAPHEIHMLHAEAMRTLGSNLWLRRGMTAWGALFSAAESYNRRVTFIAAWRIAQEQGIPNAFQFAEKAVEETQGVYNRGNKADWARGAIGGTLMTFKQFTTAYLEFLKRLPPRQRVLAMAVLFMLAGAQGLPFAEDAEDVLDTVAQGLGYSFNSRQAMRHALMRAVGQTGTDFVMNGASHLPGVPLDVQGRLSMGNLIPGSSLLKTSLTPDERLKEVTQTLGPIGDLAANVAGGVQGIVNGQVRPATKALPVLGSSAVQNVIQAVDMWQSGMYRDSKGRKVTDTTPGDAVVKGIGFQPQKVARLQRRMSEQQQNIELQKAVESRVAQQWSEGVFETTIAKDPAQREEGLKKVAEARQALTEWNQKNPDARVAIQPHQIAARVREMRMTREQRVIKHAPREIRGEVRSEFNQ